MAFLLTYILVSAMGLFFLFFFNFVIPSNFPLIPSFLEIFEIFQITFQRNFFFWRKLLNLEEYFIFFKIINSKLINYSTDMYGSCQGIIVSKSWWSFQQRKKKKIVEFILEKHVYPKIPQFVFPQKRQNLPPKNSLVSTMLGWVLEIVPKPH